ncbi:MAG: cytochrome P450 [Sphingomonadales bacterium]|nr:cytochrome P450 [Sphingomonadales bacterium]MBD3773064.1 cytochrome P450 [Paracoccaceae bacterium]
MATLASPPDREASDEFRPTHWSERLPPEAFDHLPGDDGPPLVGHTFNLLRDPNGLLAEMQARFGPVFWLRAFGQRSVQLIGPEANELVLFDRDKIFSSTQGWGFILDQLFPRGLMLLDFDHHRVDRRALSIAFKPEPMRHYAAALDRGIAHAVANWEGPRRFYPAIKALTLDTAADSFLGLPLGPEADRINRAFIDMVQAAVAPIRRPLPFTQMRKGVQGRAYIVDYFTRETERRRKGEGLGQDMFSQFANATREDGSLLPVDEVVDHMSFLMMAAHDTITSSATTLVWLLARHPEWQERLRAEILAVTGGPDAKGAPRGVTYDDLGKLELTEMAFKEALRFMPPVPELPRRALRSFTFAGQRIPAGAGVSLAVHLTHHDPAIWPEPEKFDPLRFTPDAVRARHKYAWVPFGGGAHMCLGLHFAYMQVKILMAQLLQRYRIEVAEGYAPEWQAWPIPKPKDGLQVEFVKLPSA